MGQADQAPDTPPPGDQQGGQGAGGAPVCYRHPDRETGVRCSRCNRPVCPDCMVSASVGFQCPDCVRAASGTGGPAARRPRTIAGGAVTSDPRLITKILIGINIAVFIAIQLDDTLVDKLVLIGSWPPRNAFPPGVPYHATLGLASGEWYRLVTSMFAHQEIWHIGFNMLSLWWLGGPLEAALGRARYVTLFMISGLAGGALTYLLASPTQASLGASGAIYGLFGATAVLVRRLRYDMRPVIALLVINLIFTFSISGIAWQAHIGGLVGGVAMAYAMVHAPRQRRALVQWGTCGAVLIAEAIVLAARTAALT